MVFTQWATGVMENGTWKHCPRKRWDKKKSRCVRRRVFLRCWWQQTGNTANPPATTEALRMRRNRMSEDLVGMRMNRPSETEGRRPSAFKGMPGQLDKTDGSATKRRQTTIDTRLPQGFSFWIPMVHVAARMRALENPRRGNAQEGGGACCVRQSRA